MSDNKDQKHKDAKEEAKANPKTKPTTAMKNKKPKPEALSKTDWFFTDRLREESGGGESGTA